MSGRGVRPDVTISVPVAPRCTPSVAATSGTYLARSVAAAVELVACHDDALDLVGAIVDLGDLLPGGADLAIYRETAGEQREHVSLILTDSCCYSTSHGLETA
jgi:hypothetical protein